MSSGRRFGRRNVPIAVKSSSQSPSKLFIDNLLEWFEVPLKMVKSRHRPRGRTSKAWFADREEITKMILQNAGKT
jgi:hypothetical protein